VRIGVADAASGISNSTLSVKCDFAVNGVPAGTELAGLGTFVGPGIFSISLNPAITNLPAGIVTASVLDAQGNRTTMKVRFWVAPDSFRILSASANPPSVRFENPDARTDHELFWTDIVAAPANTWSPLPSTGWEAETHRIRRLEFQGPSTPQIFLRVRAP
jgi:hypothetical protein